MPSAHGSRSGCARRLRSGPEPAQNPRRRCRRPGPLAVVAGRGYARADRDESEALVHVRVVRFTDVTAERISDVLGQIDQAGGPPPGVPIKGLQILVDEAQGTAVVLQLFDSAADMQAGSEVFAAMDPTETPGTRVSVDMCELKRELRP
jgi:hypothetical protein